MSGSTGHELPPPEPTERAEAAEPARAAGQSAGEGRRLPPLAVVMGVSGSGKSTVGELLAGRLGLPYAEADSFHPGRNVAKMSAGRPLDDEDRRPWLDAIARWLSEHVSGGGVVSCSALRRRYRDRLRDGPQGPRLFFLHLDGPEELIAGRLAKRAGHFMPGSLLRSQFEALEPLESDERGAVVPLGGPPEETARRAAVALDGT